MADNTLYYGDNLDVLIRYIKDESVDLIYLDPPFKSGQNYNVLFDEQNGSRSAAQIKAFEDTWRWDEAAARSFEKVVEAGGAVSRVLQAFRTFLGENDVLAYLSMMAPRLVELRRVLRPTGSIYLHCDPTASHYLKMLLDAVFGPENFQNEIVWGYRTGGVSKRYWPRKHDAIFMYTKSSNFTFNALQERVYYEKPFFTGQKDASGRYYADVYVRDIWDNEEKLKPVINVSADRLGYPTQKPEGLLERIIQASSNKGDVVCDPFCGCGTAVAAAQSLERRWIGIDITHLAIRLIKYRLLNAHGLQPHRDYDVVGEPADLAGARELARENPYQFQSWALGLALEDAFPADTKKGADRGIDGRLYFHDDQKKTKQIIFSVKSGKVAVSHIRDLRGVVAREKAQIGVFISLYKPTKAMRTEAASAGFYELWGHKFPRIQLFTIEELLEGNSINYPKHGDSTFKKAPRAKRKDDQSKIPLD